MPQSNPGAEAAKKSGPAMLGKYSVLQRLGTGGAASVFRCRNEDLGREVAIKLLRPSRAVDQNLTERFLREARALAQVNHPCVVQVFDIGQCEHGLYYVMELLDGQDLLKIVSSEGPLSERRALLLTTQAVLGLKAALALGVIHRDVKPANLVVTGQPPDERLKLIDFGLAVAHNAGAEPRLTQLNRIVGTPEYMSPEQARGENVDVRGDMYALGCTLYHLLAGAPPLVGKTAQDTVAAQVHKTPEPLRARRPGLSPTTEQLVMRLLAKNPDARFASYAELLHELDAALQSLPGAKRQPGGPQVEAHMALCVVEVLGDDADPEGAETDLSRAAMDFGGYLERREGRLIILQFGNATDAVLFALSVVDAAGGGRQLRASAEAGAVKSQPESVQKAMAFVRHAEPSTVIIGPALVQATSRAVIHCEPVDGPSGTRLFKAARPTSAHPQSTSFDNVSFEGPLPTTPSQQFTSWLERIEVRVAPVLAKLPERARRPAFFSMLASPLLFVAIVAALMGDPYAAELELIETGRAATAVIALEKRAEESPRARWLLARALLVSNREAEGLQKLDELLGKDPALADEETLELFVRGMDSPSPIGPKLIARHYGERAAPRLVELTTTDARLRVRHHAADALEEMGRAGDIDAVKAAVADIRLETQCRPRRKAVRTLQSLKDPRVLDAIVDLRKDPGPDPECVLELLTAAEAELRQQSGK